MEAAIETTGLTKYYGQTRGVEDVDLAVRRGEVFGFLGPNGAGKTTTIRVLLDLIRPTRGSARVLGLDAHEHSVAIHRKVGYLPGEPRMYERLTGRQLLDYFGALRDGVDATYRDGLAERLDLDLDVAIRSYSSGNRQKVALVQALMHRPELLVLDEPTNGLDPLIQQEFYRIVAEVKREGRTVFLSSHVLPEVERIADRVGIIRDGRLAVVHEIQALKQRALRRVEIRFEGPAPSRVFAGIPGVEAVKADGSIVELTVAGTLDPVVKAASRHRVHDIISHATDLEEVFLAMYRGEETAEPSEENDAG